ncbi:hypothetical protein [Streptomyces sp. DH8]|uniref:hypothetical protein n=1 Tax=Streptomyces sp. DH8 TaxID=2857008 RepID=UPI001E409A3A|nr:hypothetical protein [Streptomyces sp. DH8]
MFLLFTAVRVHAVVRALRPRGDRAPAASTDDAVPGAAVPPRPRPQPPAERRPATAAPEKEPNAGLHAFALLDIAEAALPTIPERAG